MICPNCHNEIPEGLLLCEKCGAEINLVPDFDIEIENNINETLSTIVDETFNNSSEKEDVKSQEDTSFPKSREEVLEEEFFEEKNRKYVISLTEKKGLLIVIASLVAVLVVALFVGIFIYKNFSTAYQMKKAEDSMYAGRYEASLEYVHKAEALSPEDFSVPLLEAKILKGMGDADGAKDLLYEQIQGHKMEFNTKKQYYLSLIELYAAENDYVAINELLLDSSDQAIMDEFSSYLALPPSFSIPMGNYSKSQNLILSSENEGKIYYTLDGSKPSAKNGYPYQNPIKLISGEYEIKAVFVNEFGVESQVANSFYLMDVPTPDPPLVEPASGNYEQTITVKADCPEGITVYYTMDGSNPDIETSLVYDSPIKVPFGHYNYCFMAVDENGVASEIVKRSYNLTPKTNVTVKMAQLNILNVLKEHDLVMDLSGTAPHNAGTYSYVYDTIIEISNGKYYYKFDEFLTNSAGAKNPTGLLYAVDINTNQVNRLLVDAIGSWSLIPLN